MRRAATAAPGAPGRRTGEWARPVPSRAGGRAARDHGRGGGDGGDDLAGDLLGLVPVGLADLVVARAQVGAGRDEVDVVVGVVVLLELGRHHPVAG
eukprot:scaffold105616_cov34-Phaeocystis_antarctica.AAC.1